MSIPPINLKNKNNLPIYTIVMAVILLFAAVMLLIFAPSRNQAETDLIVGLCVTSIPGLVASAFGERNSRDIRNGVVEEKAKSGAIAALVESGVQAVVDKSGKGDASVLVMQALTRLLEANTSIHVEHTNDGPTAPPPPPVDTPATPTSPVVPPTD